MPSVRPAGDAHLAHGVELEAVEPALVRGDGARPARAGRAERAYWLWPARRASTAASITSAGPSKSGKPCDRLMAPRSRARRGHLGEDRGAEGQQALGDHVTSRSTIVAWRAGADKSISPRSRSRCTGIGIRTAAAAGRPVNGRPALRAPAPRPRGGGAGRRRGTGRRGGGRPPPHRSCECRIGGRRARRRGASAPPPGRGHAAAARAPRARRGRSPPPHRAAAAARSARSGRRPAAAAATIRGSSWSVRPGITGATMHPAGHARRGQAGDGLEARGGLRGARFEPARRGPASRVVTDSQTAAAPCAASAARTSASRRDGGVLGHHGDRVSQRASTSRQRRVISSRRSTG